ncbi:peptidyl-prolyl cis-trans isomerase [Deinococcus aerolatus]|uniref:Peptidyl-prolyl cis-trans isomerase n=1 Tax=Deinococcus aerolatus TaxID=522487 RepID=A0ABQ2GEN4_9DEIO|nr:peptidylprolyl isomerase [Deinococcus aerolatus]GGL88737.1 peptidyl-prolyl cis-trans isomerase [Deinococcus aerolatus]
MNTAPNQIAQDKVVDLEYTLTVNGEIVDQSEPGEPLTYLHGHSNIIPGLEKALEGKAAGERMQVTVQPEDGYGERDETNTEELAREDFEDDIEIGETYYAQAEDGSVIPFTVMDVNGDTVKVDFNPPLAGMVLNFDVTVVDVRDATAEELEHGHAHTPDMHEHE